MHAGILQQLVERLFRGEHSRYTGGSQLADALIDHGDFQIGGLPEKLGGLLQQAGRNVKTPRRQYSAGEREPGGFAPPGGLALLERQWRGGEFVTADRGVNGQGSGCQPSVRHWP